LHASKVLRTPIGRGKEEHERRVCRREHWTKIENLCKGGCECFFTVVLVVVAFKLIVTVVALTSTVVGTPAAAAQPADGLQSRRAGASKLSRLIVN